MVAYGTAALCYTLICFCLISGTECYGSGADNTLSVQPGGSVTIPCYYDSKYTQQRKYWFSDADKIKIFTNFTNETVSVIDHPAQSLFTVTMRNLTHGGSYFCVVENESLFETYINVQPAPPDVSVVSSNVSGDEGGNISVKCLYSSAYKNKHKQWCRYKDKRCYTSQNSSVEISDDERASFTVLMSGLMLEDSGWYFCSVDHLQAPVYLTVTAVASVTIHSNTETTNDEKMSLWLPVSAGLLMVIILVGVCTWKWRKRSAEDKKQIKYNAPDTATVPPEEPVIYSAINDENPNDISLLESKANTIYSTIEDLPGCEAQSPAGGTVYSTVAPH
ncbi:uncharacterized protein LOC130554481 isoform X2 [Triplophysa rosa]|uniref:uncharacterized protein LOC130554481 isoform X2 n=1 Tax=Triplophysa rosa TaxID=992332 RepID=UPI002545F030|nr:uncharacterized protein LOC130554481 isoform X2 [Triplophysa rosa]